MNYVDVESPFPHRAANKIKHARDFFKRPGVFSPGAIAVRMTLRGGVAVKPYQPRRAPRTWPPLYVAALAALGWIACAPGAAHAERPHRAAIDRGTRQDIELIAQDDQGEDAEVSSTQVEKYIAVYKAMQRNRNLTVEKAAARQGMTVEQFRTLENRIQRDDAAMQHVRDELQASAARAPTSSKTPH
jgi:hypothetical protein